MAIGSALARGILAGIGKGGQDIVEDKREKARDKAKSETQFKLFKDQTDYAAAKQEKVVAGQRKFQQQLIGEEREFQAGQKAEDRIFQERQFQAHRAAAQKDRIQLSSIQTNNQVFAAKVQATMSAQRSQFDAQVQAGARYKELAVKSPKELAGMLAHEYAKNFPKELYGRMYNESLKSNNKKDVAALVRDLDGAQADYTQFIGTPFEAAIPTGVGPIDTSGQFVMNTEQASDRLTEQTVAFTEGDKKRQVTKNTIQAGFSSQAGTGGLQLSDNVASYISGLFPDGKILNPQGENMANIAIQGLIDNDELQRVEGGYAFTRDINIANAEQEALEAQRNAGVGTVLMPQDDVANVEPTELRMQPEVTPLELRTTTVDSPAAQQALEAEAQQVVQGDATKLNEKFNKAATLQTHDTLNGLLSEVETMSPQVRAQLFGAGSISETIRDLDAKSGDADALEAKAFLSRLETFAGKVRHEQFGSAQTTGEMASWEKQLQAPGVLANPETLMAQLTSKRDLMVKDIKAISGGTSDEAKREWQRGNPSFDVTEHMDFKDRGFDMSGLDESEQDEIRAYIDGGGDASVVEAFIKQNSGD